MGKPRRPRGGRPAGSPQPLRKAPAPAEIRPAPIAEDAPAPASDFSVETHEPQAEPAQAAPAAITPILPETASEVPADGPTETAAQAVPEAGAAADIAVPPVPDAVGVPDRIVFTPDRFDVVEIGSTIARYVRGEGEAALAHLRALSGARSPAEVIRLQVGEVQRAADASLTCWVTVIGQTSRVVAYR
ncbi:hypothetical protein ACN9MF_22505 [Methylobacterium fujisawaense]|uniref:phasin family protein n=1 Tax=Methylobacterium fujisawaense TaxID=107400 RepID=UPI003CF8CE6F